MVVTAVKSQVVDTTFDAVFRRHYARVHAVAIRLASNDAEAEELAQETFIRLHDSPVLQRPDAEVQTWLLRVVTNLALNAIRGRQREQARLQRLGTLEIATTASQTLGADPANVLVRKEERQLVRDVLQEVPARARACLVLRHSGLSYAEIAQAVGIAPGSVGTTLARAERAFVEAWRRRTDGV